MPLLPFLAPFVHLRVLLDSMHPGFFNALLAVAIWAALWAVRRWKPDYFAKLPIWLQAWPALVSGAVVGLLSAGLGPDPVTAVIGVLGSTLSGLFSGIAGVGLHRTLKESPLKYGSLPVADPPLSGRVRP